VTTTEVTELMRVMSLAAAAAGVLSSTQVMRMSTWMYWQDFAADGAPRWPWDKYHGGTSWQPVIQTHSRL